MLSYVDVSYAVLLDFSKAFDKVPHQRLLLKLQHCGIRGNLMRWIENFLSAVVTDSTKSPVTSGVPRARPTAISSLYKRHASERTVHKKKLFADDSLFYKKITNPRDCALLEQDLDRLQEWEKSGKWPSVLTNVKCCAY